MPARSTPRPRNIAPRTPLRRANTAEEAMRAPESPQYRQMLAVLTQFRIVVANLKRHYHDIEKTTGLNGTQVWAMIAIAQQPGIKVGELARELAIHQSTASNMLDRLAELGHIERAREGADQRVVSIYLTEQGAQTVTHAPQPAMGLLQHALLSLPDERVAGLRDHLDELLRAISPDIESGQGTPLSILLHDGEDSPPPAVKKRSASR